MPQVFGKLINHRNDQYYYDAGESDCMVRDGEHFTISIFLDEELLNMVKA